MLSLYINYGLFLRYLWENGYQVFNGGCDGLATQLTSRKSRGTASHTQASLHYNGSEHFSYRYMYIHARIANPQLHVGTYIYLHFIFYQLKSKRVHKIRYLHAQRSVYVFDLVFDIPTAKRSEFCSAAGIDISATTSHLFYVMITPNSVTFQITNTFKYLHFNSDILYINKICQKEEHNVEHVLGVGIQNNKLN